MNYAVISNINGTFKIESEWSDNLEGAKVNFFQKCATLTAAHDVIKATLKLIDEDYEVVEGKVEHIVHEAEEEE